MTETAQLSSYIQWLVTSYERVRIKGTQAVEEADIIHTTWYLAQSVMLLKTLSQALYLLEHAEERATFYGLSAVKAENILLPLLEGIEVEDPADFALLARVLWNAEADGW